MDNIFAESEDVQGIPELNFGIPQTTQFVTERRQQNWFPSGSSIYSPIRTYAFIFQEIYLDLSSVRLFATIEYRNGDSAKFLRPLGGLHSFFFIVILHQLVVRLCKTL